MELRASVSFPGLSVLHLPDALAHDFSPVFQAAEKPYIKLRRAPSTREPCITCMERRICVGPKSSSLDGPRSNGQNASKQTGAIEAEIPLAASPF